jgi:phosphonate transport system ATP-binding protein
METSLHIKDLHKTYQNGKPVLKGIDLTVQGNGLTAIIGPSGTGKSTLLRCLNRLVEPSQGSLLLSSSEGQVDLAQVKGRQLRMARRQIGMVFQEYNLVERLTVMENLLTGRLGYVGSWKAWRRKFDATDIAYAFELLAEVGLSDFTNQRADALSGGQRQRVGIARALMQRPRLLLADEPTSSLDPKTSVEIMQLLKDQGQRHRIPVIVNIHDVDLAKRFADRIVGMTGGHVVYDNSPEGLNAPTLQKIYGGESWLH